MYVRALAAPILAIVLIASQPANAQSLQLDTSAGVRAAAWATEDERSIPFTTAPALFSVHIDGDQVGSDEGEVTSTSPLTVRLRTGVTARILVDREFDPGWKATVTFENQSADTIRIENVVPFGQIDDHVYITATGPWSLARTKLFRPGESPVGVILPDNAWEMGYGAVNTTQTMSVAAIARRIDIQKGDRTRWHADIAPGGTLTYTLHADAFEGPWQSGLRLMFQDRYLYDLKTFENDLFEREDLKWIRDQYVIGLQMAWDHNFYDDEAGVYRLNEFLAEADSLFGGFDVYGLWPTWPRLGVDQRNQWDMYRDLPGGLSKLRELSDAARRQGTRFFISYNPWDQSTRTENEYEGMATLIDAIDVDGVVLDTRGSSSYELQAAADSVRSGVVMYSEGMAVPKDMPGIVSGRVHDAIRMPPPLNLNKLIKPEFAIFRVGQIANGHLRRDAATSLFNGYGVEINTFFPGRPAWMDEEFLYLGRTARILRENSSAFNSRDWTPLIESRRDSIWVNRWPDGDKTIFTVFSLVPAGHDGLLFPLDAEGDVRLVDLWHHEEVVPDTIDGALYVPVSIDAFNVGRLGTGREGSVSAVAAFPRLLDAVLDVDSLTIGASRGDRILLWAGEPSYQNRPQTFSIDERTVSLRKLFGRFEGKFVAQLFDGERLIDERVVQLEPGTPRRISRVERTAPAATAPDGMIRVSGATIAPELTGRGFGSSGIVHYPAHLADGREHDVATFYIDRYPVTNAEFKAFLDATGYEPDDPTNFLKHWEDGRIPDGLERHPVVYVDLDDARAYAAWAGKRLPTEAEWQLAAQGTDDREWPWGNEFDSTRVNVGVGETTPVDAHPAGASPYGVEDLVGNVWQLTNDEYDDGSYRFVMMRGGSYYQPTASWWYVQGGPRPLTERQVLLRVAPGFDRNSTVGFRLVKDAR